jgi:hypothetical protein
MYYNFAKIHKSLRVTPAMEAGISDHVWSIEEIARLVPEPVVKKRGNTKRPRNEVFLYLKVDYLFCTWNSDFTFSQLFIAFN